MPHSSRQPVGGDHGVSAAPVVGRLVPPAGRRSPAYWTGLHL